MNIRPCPVCQGARLRKESLFVRISGLNIYQVAEKSIREALDFFGNLDLSAREREIARRILKEISERLGFLVNVGLDYLTLSRSSATLSGGESERIRLATQIGSGLLGVLYILDEPSIGLHQRDNARLLSTLMRLRDLGNTILVVEHDEETILKCGLCPGPWAGGRRQRRAARLQRNAPGTVAGGKFSHRPVSLRTVGHSHPPVAPQAQGKVSHPDRGQRKQPQKHHGQESPWAFLPA